MAINDLVCEDINPILDGGGANLPPKRFFLNNSLTTKQIKF